MFKLVYYQHIHHKCGIFRWRTRKDLHEVTIQILKQKTSDKRVFVGCVYSKKKERFGVVRLIYIASSGVEWSLSEFSTLKIAYDDGTATKSKYSSEGHSLRYMTFYVPGQRRQGGFRHCSSGGPLCVAMIFFPVQIGYPPLSGLVHLNLFFSL